MHNSVNTSSIRGSALSITRQSSARQINASVANRQRGVVLLYGLFILFILTFIAVATMEMLVVTEKMAGNYQDEMIAQQKAEAAILEAEDWLLDVEGAIDVGPELLVSGSTPMVWELGIEGQTAYLGSEDSAWVLDKDDDWWEDRAIAVADYENTYYFTEFVAFLRDELSQDGNYGNQAAGDYFYRVTSKAYGEGRSNVLLQTIYLRKYE